MVIPEALVLLHRANDPLLNGPNALPGASEVAFALCASVFSPIFVVLEKHVREKKCWTQLVILSQLCFVLILLLLRSSGSSRFQLHSMASSSYLDLFGSLRMPSGNPGSLPIPKLGFVGGDGMDLSADDQSFAVGEPRSSLAFRSLPDVFI